MKLLLIAAMLVCFPLSALSQTQYFDSNGNSVTEAEYMKIKEQWYEYLAKNRKNPNVVVRYVRPEPAPPAAGITVAPESRAGEIPQSVRSGAYGTTSPSQTYDDLPRSGSGASSGLEQKTYVPHQDTRIKQRLRMIP